MKLPLEIFLALRYLRPKRTFVSVITLISIIGVMLGVAVLIIVISVMSGFDRQLRDSLMGFNAHIVATHYNSTLHDYVSLMETLERHPDVAGVAPFVVGQALVKTQPDEGSPQVLAPLIRGIDPEREPNVSRILQSVITSEGPVDLGDNGALIGKAMARRLNLSVGDFLAIYSIRDLERMEQQLQDGKETAILPDELEVRGIYDSGHYEFNDLFVIVPIRLAKGLYNLQTSVHGLSITIKNPDNAQAIRDRLMNIVPPEILLTTWMEEYSGILDAIRVEKSVMFYILFFIMIVAAFGITSAMITFVVQKTREIGMLKALGATNRQVVGVFFCQSLCVGIVGVGAGLGLGLLAVHYRNEFLAFMRRITEFELFPADIYLFDQLPALIIPNDVLLIAGGSLLICLLAGVIPAWNAGRLKPVEALRHE